MHHALGPANPLSDEASQRLRRKSCDHWAFDIGTVVAFGMKSKSGFGVFGDGIPGNAADFLEAGAAQDGGRAAEERGVPEVESFLDDLVEHFALAGHTREGIEIFFDGVGIGEKVGGLDEEEFGIFEKKPDGVLQNIAGGDVVGIQNENQLAFAV